MKRLRTLRRFVPFLIGLFMVAQLAGVVSSEEMHPDAGIAVAAADQAVDHAAHQHGHAGENHHHSHHGTGGAIDHGLAGNGVAGQCCALHAFMVGMVPMVLTTPTVAFRRGEQLEIDGDRFTGLGANRLDRPPRSLLSL